MQATQRSGEDAHLKLEVQEMTASTAAAEHAAQVDATLDAEARYSTECAKVEQLAQQMAMMQSKLATTEAVFLPSPAVPAHSRFAAHARSPQPRPIAIFEPPTRPPTDPTVPTHPTHGDTETRTLARGRAVTPEAARSCLACGAPIARPSPRGLILVQGLTLPTTRRSSPVRILRLERQADECLVVRWRLWVWLCMSGTGAAERAGDRECGPDGAALVQRRRRRAADGIQRAVAADVRTLRRPQLSGALAVYAVVFEYSRTRPGARRRRTRSRGSRASLRTRQAP